MFETFFYQLKAAGLPVNPTAFLTLHRAMAGGLVNSLDDFYVAARAILIKSEKYFDRYDQVFAHLFQGGSCPMRSRKNSISGPMRCSTSG